LTWDSVHIKSFFLGLFLLFVRFLWQMPDLLPVRPSHFCAMLASSLVTAALSHGVPLPPVEVFLAVKHLLMVIRNLGPAGFIVGIVALGLSLGTNVASRATNHPRRIHLLVGATEILLILAGSLLTGGVAFFLGCMAFREFEFDRHFRAASFVVLAGFASALPGLLEVFVPEPQSSPFMSLWQAFQG
jgi:hypothetical protein